MAQGPQDRKVESRAKLDTIQGANWLKGIIDNDKPARCSSTLAASAAASLMCCARGAGNIWTRLSR
jgi:hypothetical protein